MLSQTEIIVLTLAIAADSFTTSWFSGALHHKLDIALDRKLPVFFAMGRLLFLVLGFGAGYYAATLFPYYSYLSGLSLLSVIGIKYGIESLKFYPEEKVILIDNRKTILMLSIAGSINTFIAGIAFGIAGIGLATPVVVIIAAVAGFTYVGMIAGKVKGYRPSIRYVGLVSSISILAITLRLFVLNLIK
ncbi:MAG: manganese efflux pump [Bacteroidota bacterium]